MQQQTSTLKTPLAHALEYAARGRPVFPCSPTNKRPCVPKWEGGNGFHDATTDANQIRRWWQRYPTAMIGMPTGQASGVVVVDCDVHKAGGQVEYEQVRGRLSATLAALSASGGIHLYYRHPGQYTKDANPLKGFQTIDIRGDGGYIILPGSVRDIGVYRWANRLPIAPLPTWILDTLSTPTLPAPRTRTKHTPTEQADGDIWYEGTRGQHMRSLAGRLIRQGISDDDLLAAMREANATHCRPLWSDSEVVRTWDWIRTRFSGRGRKGVRW